MMDERAKREFIIKTAIGLQDVDHLQNSPFFLKQAERYINGEITLDELSMMIDEYYKDKSHK